MSPTRLALAAGLAILVGAVNGPANASLTFNSLSLNAITLNALNFNGMRSNGATANAPSHDGFLTAGAAIADLNGVAVEDVVLPTGIRR